MRCTQATPALRLRKHGLYCSICQKLSNQTRKTRKHVARHKVKSFADYRTDGDVWITLSTGEYYPDILPLACELYKPVLFTFERLLESAHSSSDLYMAIMEQPGWMRTQLCRVFRKYVSPETPVEMLKKKRSAKDTCDRFGKGFRAVTDVQKRFKLRPIPDEALCAILMGI